MQRTSQLVSGLAMLLAALIFGGAPGQDPLPPETAEQKSSGIEEAEDATPQRVVLQLGRHDRVHGKVEREDDAMIVIRTPDDEVKAFHKARITYITRLVDPQPGQRGSVILSDGSVREGVIIEDAYDYVIVEIEGIKTRLERSVVRQVRLLPTNDEIYRDFKSRLRPDMYMQRFQLCQWLIDQRMYREAEVELASLYADKPDLPRVYELLRMVRAQLMLDADLPGNAATNGGQPESTSPAENESTGPVIEKDVLPDQILTHEDVNIIRVFEIDFRNPPQVRIAPETIRALIENYASHAAMPTGADARNALFRADPIDIVRLMFEVKARELYSQIEVLSEPHALNLFRQRVHNTWLIQNCATSRCHGGVGGGRLFLHSRHSEDPRVRYTNFLILERLVLDPEHPLINYEEPLMSKVIQHGLPRAEARDPHPEVPGWKSVFHRGNPRLLEDAIRWIESMYPSRPDYPVEYEPPKLGKALQEGPGLPSEPERVDR